MTPTLEQLKTIVGNAKGVEALYESMIGLAPKYGVNTAERWAGFIAQTAHESGKYRYTHENLNYSATRLNQVFAKYFKKAGRSTKGYVKNPVKLANLVYANRMGNGDVESGDGYTYRGRGIIQLTGKNNYEQFAKHLGVSLSQAVEYAGTADGIVESAFWYWSKHNINRHCDNRDIKGMTRAINGGTNGLADREKIWKKALDVFGVEEPDVWFDGMLSIGDRGDDVATIQECLGVTADGIFGPNTKRAVKQYQRNNKLIPDGIVGPRTFKAIVEG